MNAKKSRFREALIGFCLVMERKKGSNGGRCRSSRGIWSKQLLDVTEARHASPRYYARCCELTFFSLLVRPQSISHTLPCKTKPDKTWTCTSPENARGQTS